jgi:thioredoxin reductase (NADPH)
MKREDVIIIGAGPAGLAAAIQLIRNGINPMIFERRRSGGLL